MIKRCLIRVLMFIGGVVWSIYAWADDTAYSLEDDYAL